MPVALLLILAVLAAACGSDTPTSPDDEESSNTPTSVAVTCTAAGAGHQCRASAILSGGATVDITSSATWTSSNATVATVDAAGRVTHLGSGQVEIRATYQSLFGGTILLLNVTVTSITVTCTPEAAAHSCTAVAQFSNGTSRDVTRSGALWTSSNHGIATVDGTGRVTHTGNGQVEIAASFQSVVGGLVLTLSGVVTLTSVSVTCNAQFEAHQCEASARFSDNSVRNVTSQATWTSSNTFVATVDAFGLVRHRTTGQAEIRATLQGVTGAVTLDIVVSLSGTSVVINEFATRGDGSTEDWVELRNDSPSPVDISGWQIKEWIPSSGVRIAFTAASGVVLAPGCHYLLTFRPEGVAGLPRDARIEALNLGGGLALTRADDTIVDQVGYHPDSIFVEGTPLPQMQIDDTRSYTRAGNDTNNNAADFLLRARTPLNSGSSCAVR